MEIWLEDIIEQICTANILVEGKTSSGKRLAMIIVDNAVEFSLKAYVESYRRLVGKEIKRKDWEQTKRNFEEVLNFVDAQLAQSGTSINKNEILHNHDMRNDLYHGAKPFSVEPKVILRYIKTAKDLLKNLFGLEMSKEKWDEHTKSIKNAILGEEILRIKKIEFNKTEEGIVRMKAEKRMGERTVVCLVIDGFISKIGRPSNLDELETSLNLSDQGIKRDRLNSRISELRKRKLIEKKELRLTSKGRKWLKELKLL